MMGMLPRAHHGSRLCNPTPTHRMSELTHFDAHGQAHMVDVAQKAHTHRVAVAQGRIHMQARTLALIAYGNAKKGDVLGVARLAGIMENQRPHPLVPPLGADPGDGQL